MAKKQKEDKLAPILQSIENQNEEQLLKTLKEIKKVGDKRVVKVLLDLYKKNVFSKVNSEILEIFNQLQLESAQDELILLLDTEEYANERATFLATIWNSGKMPNKHLAKLVEFATLGDTMTTIECFTIIDNMEPPFREEWLMDAQMVINQYLTQGASQSEVDQLFNSIVDKIRTWESLTNN